MTLPEYPPKPVQAPADAGIGLSFPERGSIPDRDWPADWWQRNLEEPIVDPDAPDPVPLSGRELKVPPPP